MMDVLHRDTTGYSWKYRIHFQWTDKEAIYGLGSHMEDYLNLRTIIFNNIKQKDKNVNMCKC